MDPIGLVVALTALFTAASGAYLAKRAQRDKDRQEKVALKIAEDNAHLQETQQALDAYERVVGMHQREIDRLHEENERVAKELSSERTHARENNRVHGELIDRYRKALMSLLQSLLLIRSHLTTGDAGEVDKAMTEVAELMKSDD